MPRIGIAALTPGSVTWTVETKNVASVLCDPSIVKLPSSWSLWGAFIAKSKVFERDKGRYLLCGGLLVALGRR